MLSVEEELKRLLRRLERLRNALEDAERKGIQDTAIRSWLCELKDMMDLCKVEAAEDNPKPSARRCFPLSSCFTGTKMGTQIKLVNDRLKEIAEDSTILSRLDNRQQGEVSTVVNCRQTSPVFIESDIVGEDIEVATRHLVESLIKEDDGHRRKCRVFGIVGMGGIGKTTLARKVYNHTTTVEHFPIRIWVCVSQTFSETDLLKQIIRGAGGVCGEASSRAELEPILVSSLLGKKFFLVLDDVWTAGVWEDLLRIPLECGAVSGRIVVTTRSEIIARAMRASVHYVHKMNNRDGWTLLCKAVLFGDYEDKEAIIELKDVGIQIIDKCDGLPLAVKAIARVLRSKETSRKEWEKVLQRHAWLLR